jgi:two-component system chemotaxis response regulator CheY
MFPPSTRILIVDDMSSLRELLKAYLRRLGLKQLSEASDGREAYTTMIQAKAAGAPFELVISDWNMPGVSGIEFLKLVRAIPEWKNLPFIMLTTENEKDRVLEAVRSGASNYVVKPIEEKVLEEKLLRVWQKLNPASIAN